MKRKYWCQAEYFEDTTIIANNLKEAEEVFLKRIKEDFEKDVFILVEEEYGEVNGY